jgi:cell shape-determining protein MreC
MSNRQTVWSIFIIAVLSLTSLLYSVSQFNIELEKSRHTNIALQKQIEEVKSYDLLLKNDTNVLKNRIKNLEKDLEVTQELQRKQALAILELRKGKKK